MVTSVTRSGGELHLPRQGETAGQMKPLLMLLSLPTFGLALAISVWPRTDR